MIYYSFNFISNNRRVFSAKQKLFMYSNRNMGLLKWIISCIDLRLNWNSYTETVIVSLKCETYLYVIALAVIFSISFQHLIILHWKLLSEILMLTTAEYWLGEIQCQLLRPVFTRRKIGVEQDWIQARRNMMPAKDRCVHVRQKIDAGHWEGRQNMMPAMADNMTEINMSSNVKWFRHYLGSLLY